MDRRSKRGLLGTGEAEEVVCLLLQWGRPSRQGKGALGVDGGHQGVAGQGGEIGQQTAEAVDREAIFGSSGGLFGDRGRRARGLGNDTGAQGFGGLLVGLVIEYGRQ